VKYTDEEFDELLTAALYRAADLDYEDIPSDEELDELIQPSPRFQRRMKALLRNPNRYVRRMHQPAYLKILRSAAAVFIAFTILLGGAMTVSSTVRAAVIDFVRSWFDDRTEYWTPTHEISKEWVFGYIPDGFNLIFQEDFLQIIRVYQRDDSVKLSITVTTGRSIVDNEHSIFYETEINGRAADIYESNDPMYQSIIVLHDEASDEIITIISDIALSELIKIAEGIE
jgi:hypothetical protein